MSGGCQVDVWGWGPTTNETLVEQSYL